MLKISVCRTFYFRNHTSCDLCLWYTCMYKRIMSPGIFFIFFKILIFRIIRGSVVSRAILKPVYRFGIPISDSQTLKSVKINSFENIQMTVYALVPQCALSVLSYSECKIAKIFWGFIPGPYRGELTALPRLLSCTTVFLLPMLVKKPAPSKNCWILH